MPFYRSLGKPCYEDYVISIALFMYICNTEAHELDHMMSHDAII